MKNKVAVVSHHRSGTHFVMRALAENSVHQDSPSWKLDYNLGVDIWSTPVLRKYLARHSGKGVKEIMKCHFEVEFFDNILKMFTSEFHVFYVIRHPEDVLASYFRFSKTLPWLEAPECSTLSEFIRMPPEGSCLRWQRRQYESMATRWAGHVRGWLEAAKHYPIHVIFYDDLLDKYEETMEMVSELLGEKKSDLKTPEPTGILPWKGGSHADLYDSDDREFLRTAIGGEILSYWPARE